MSGSARWAIGLIPVRPGRSSDIEMRPRAIIDKFFEEKAANNSPGLATALADVLNVGNLAFHISLVFFFQRKFPELLTGHFPGGADCLEQFWCIGHDRGNAMS